jgi:hypothetical protein
LKQKDVLAVELRDRLTDLPRELGLKIGCERHVDGGVEIRAEVITLTMSE